MRTLFDTPGLTIIHDPANKWLFATWRGEHDETSSMAGCAMILNKVRLTHCTAILNDSSQVLDGWSEIVRWIALEFFHALADSGVVAIAWVTAKDWPARTDIERVLLYTTRPLVDTFSETESAYSWLLSTATKKP
ncbi:hypothetical protein MTX78_11460 [Hymenobacter tibetensis]|uniref:STAS/SEC14 domain-containing protein n=1 Tax=Hymenobacter tibetensis TaxID=497967 RepID=A0ABY4CYI5_9BACT|nr:hypothetical protein [Hymenobacter tibetensis]UOG72743.1 hypothetical protein MTX78_11460 [Hymenobacter tibetensis]